MGFQPVNSDDFRRIKVGEVISVSWVKPRNPAFHRKVFGLFKFVFDMVPEYQASIEYGGLDILPRTSFDQTRKWLTVKAGYFDVYGLPDGSVRIEAKSLSFANMGDEEFERLFSSLINVALEVMPQNMTDESVRIAVDEILRFE